MGVFQTGPSSHKARVFLASSLDHLLEYDYPDFFYILGKATMIHWLVTVISLWVMLQPDLATAENFTDLAYYEDYETNFVQCPNVIKVEWNVLLSREPHVIKYSNGTESFYDGLFPRKCIVRGFITVPMRERFAKD